MHSHTNLDHELILYGTAQQRPLCVVQLGNLRRSGASMQPMRMCSTSWDTSSPVRHFNASLKCHRKASSCLLLMNTQGSKNFPRDLIDLHRYLMGSLKQQKYTKSRSTG